MFADAAIVGVLFFLGFVSLGVAILVVLRYWLVEGTLETGPALGVLLALLLGSAWAVKSASPFLIFFWIVVMLGGSLGLPTLSALGEKRALHQMYEDDIAKYKNVLQADAANPAAWREMGELYFKMSRYDEAIAAYKEAIRLNPHDVQDIRRRLNRALDYRAGVATTATVVCEQCKSETAAGKTCQNCGAPLETNFFEWFLQAKNLREILNPTIAITAGVVAFFTLFSALPIGMKAVALAICVLLGGFFLWRATQEAD